MMRAADEGQEKNKNKRKKKGRKEKKKKKKKKTEFLALSPISMCSCGCAEYACLGVPMTTLNETWDEARHNAGSLDDMSHACA